MTRQKDGSITLPIDFKADSEAINPKISFTGDKLQNQFNNLAVDVGNSLDRHGNGAMLANLNGGGLKAINFSDPTDPQDLATKKYVDQLGPEGYLLQNGTRPLTANWNVGGKIIDNIGDVDETKPKAAVNFSYVNNHLMELKNILKTMFIGSLILRIQDAAPTDIVENGITMLLCDGRDLSTTTYPELFNVIKYKWGGSGVNFKLPDTSTRYPRGSKVANDTTYLDDTVQQIAGKYRAVESMYNEVSGVFSTSTVSNPFIRETTQDPRGLDVVLTFDSNLVARHDAENVTRPKSFKTYYYIVAKIV